MSDKIAAVREIAKNLLISDDAVTHFLNTLELCGYTISSASDTPQTGQRASANEESDTGGVNVNVTQDILPAEAHPSASAMLERRRDQRRKVTTTYLCRGLPIEGIVDCRTIHPNDRRQSIQPASATSQPAAEGTPTPRTEEWWDRIGASYGWADFARTLERELAEAKIETARILEIGKQFERDGRSTFAQSCINLHRAESAEAKLAAAQEDAERYRWLRDASVINGSIPSAESELWNELGDLLGDDFEKAVDAARAERKEPSNG